MKREIKFRYWSGKTMYNNIGVHPHFATAHYLDPDTAIEYKDGEDGCLTMCSGLAKFPIMQYTGLKDSKGKEIYEGDILKGSHSPNSRKPPIEHDVVIWKGSGWKRESYNGDMKVTPDIDCRSMEVIGNIYQHPELLK